MDYTEAVRYLYSFTDYERGHRRGDPLNYDLRRMEELLNLLGNPHLGPKSVHVAGSKGKGSTAAMIAAVFACAGYRTGLYTSPHLLDIRERFRLNGRMASEEEVAGIVERLRPAVEAVNGAARYGKLTTFELLTALGFSFFRSEGAEFQVIEVGLGGRLDATNVVYPEVAVLTNISLEHTDVLGDSIAQIAAEKAGIVKPGITVVSAPQTEEAEGVIRRRCGQCEARLIEVGKEVSYRVSDYGLEGQQIEVYGRLGHYALTLPLLGLFQAENAAVAVASLETLMEKGYAITPTHIIQGLAQVSWPGRFQILSRSPVIVADGAHSPYSALSLRKSLELYLSSLRPRILVFGISQDKDARSMMEALLPFFDAVVATSSSHPRALAVDELASRLALTGLEILKSPGVAEAISLARALSGSRGLICVTGSLFVAAEAIGRMCPSRVS